MALVHDLVEAYAGDTQTLKISDEEKEAKAAREEAAISRISDEYKTVFPYIPKLMTIYEENKSPEARFVKPSTSLCLKSHISLIRALHYGRRVSSQAMQRLHMTLNESPSKAMQAIFLKCLRYEKP